jgi:membrane protease YdiL (CAAX protease family)
MRFGWPAAPHLTWNSLLGTSIGVGFFEEIPFRGYILMKLATRMNFWLANMLTSLLFVGGHRPGWLSLHLSSSTGRFPALAQRCVRAKRWSQASGSPGFHAARYAAL